MKRLLTMLALAALTACGGSTTEPVTPPVATTLTFEYDLWNFGHLGGSYPAIAGEYYVRATTLDDNGHVVPNTPIFVNFGTDDVWVPETTDDYGQWTAKVIFKQYFNYYRTLTACLLPQNPATCQSITIGYGPFHE